MLNRLRDQLGGAGFVVAIVALIAALGGGAYAATHAATASKKAKPLTKAQIIALIKSHAGSGPVGPAGPAGAPGAPGKDGLNGTNGKDGTNGTNGTNGQDGEDGVDGTSVTSSESAGTIDGTHCVNRGGSKFTAVNGNTYACNGEKGEKGDPWTAGGTLPVGATETGTWASPTVGGSDANDEYHIVISFPIPLAAPLEVPGDSDENQVHIITESGEEVLEEGGIPTGFGPASSACPGSAEEPEAESGNLCIYIGSEVSPNVGSLIAGKVVSKPGGENSLGAGTTGAVWRFITPSNGTRAQGSFAVTG